jgi:anti-sigma B factor antagonist
MPFTVEERYFAAVVAIEGRFLGSIEGGRFRESIEELRQAGKTYVVVDLSKADFMDSTGLGVLISGLTTLRRSGGDLRLAGVAKRIKPIFLMTKLLSDVFEDHETVDDAIASFRERPPAPVSADVGVEGKAADQA